MTEGYMKRMKTILFTIALIVSAQAIAMEAPAAPPTNLPLIPITQFTKLPGDIQKILYTEIMNGGLYQTVHTVLSLARTSKQLRAYVNDNIIAILESMHTSKAIELVAILYRNAFYRHALSLPSLDRDAVYEWCEDADARLRSDDGQLHSTIAEPNVFDVRLKLNAVHKLLANKNIDLNWPNNLGKCLGTAAGTGQTEIVRALLHAGANPNFSDKGNTPLMLAKRINAQEVMALLLQYGANRIINSYGQTVDNIEYNAYMAENMQRLYHDNSKRNFSFADETQSFKRPRN
jgi:hypothetical protein